MPLHRRRRSRRAPGHGKLRQPVLKLQQCRGIQIGKANDAFLVHPAHKQPQREEIVQHRTRPQRQSGAQRAGADQADQLPAGLQQGGVAPVGETSPILHREVPAQAHGVSLLQRVGGRENPGRVFPTRLLQEPRSIVGGVSTDADGRTRHGGRRCGHGTTPQRKSGRGGSRSSSGLPAASSSAPKRGRMSSSRIRNCGAYRACHRAGCRAAAAACR